MGEGCVLLPATLSKRNSQSEGASTWTTETAIAVMKRSLKKALFKSCAVSEIANQPTTLLFVEKGHVLLAHVHPPASPRNRQQGGLERGRGKVAERGRAHSLTLVTRVRPHMLHSSTRASPCA